MKRIVPLLLIVAVALIALRLSKPLRYKTKTEAATTQSAESVRELRVCADPNNLPFSNDKMEGFENKLAELIASEMNAKLEYTWWAQRKNFIKNSLNEG